MAPGSRRRRECGFTYLGVLFLMVLMGLGLAGTAQLWSIASRRAHERELLWIGNQYARALKSYYEQSPGTRQYPLRLEDLLVDSRFPVPRHHLRQLYVDPVTRDGWGVILNPDGRIGGVHSLSDEAPLKQDGFPLKWDGFKGTARYSDWRFLVDARLVDATKQPAVTGGAAPTPAAAGAAAQSGIGATSSTPPITGARR
ncbi:MAG TPA: type II secretion system protein [Ramlibacter sp.]|nr:type II secretion system protein [Ramlibacter sp.]